MQIKQSMISGNGDQKTFKTAKVESVAVSKKGSLNASGGAQKSSQLQEMSAYLKIVSRMENLNARQDSLPGAAIQGFIQGLEKQVAQMNDHEKALLLRIPEVKSLNVKNTEELLNKIEDKLTDGKAGLKLFELLRQPQFVDLIDPSHKVQTYDSKVLAQPAVTSSGPETSQQTQQPVPIIIQDEIATSSNPAQTKVETSTVNPQPTNG